MVPLVFYYVMHFFFLLSRLRLIFFFSYARFFSKCFLLVNFCFIYFLFAFLKPKPHLDTHTQKTKQENALLTIGTLT